MVGNGGFKFSDPFIINAENLNKLNPGGLVSQAGANSVNVTARRVYFGYIEEYWPAVNALSVPSVDGVYLVTLPVTEFEEGVTDTPVVLLSSDYNWEKTQIILARILVSSGEIAAIESINQFMPAQLRYIQISEPGQSISLTADTQQQITFDPGSISILNGNNANGANTDSWWDSANNKFTPQFIEDRYMLRFNCLALPTQTNKSLFIRADIGGAQGIILESTNRLVKGTSVPTRISKTDTIYCKSTFLSNGATFYLECDGNCTVTNLSIVIDRTAEGYNL